MGWLDRLRPRSAKRGRGPARTAEERLRTEQARYLRRLAVTNPALYDQIMARQIGVELEPERDRLDTVVTTIKQLREAGLLPKSAREIGEQSWVKEIAELVGVALSVYAQQQARLVMPPAPPWPTPASPAQGRPAAAAGGDASAASAYTGAGSPLGGTPPNPPGPPAAAAESSQEAQMHWVSSYIISQLENKSPAEAARWLLGAAARFPQAQGIVERLRSTGDEELLALLGELARERPEAAGLVAWLRSRPGWLVETIKAIRELAAGGGEIAAL